MSVDWVRDDDGHGHGTQKPVECMRRPIENNSSPGQAIYGPFSGSGTTIVAAEITGRSSFAIEIDPAYVDVAVSQCGQLRSTPIPINGRVLQSPLDHFVAQPIGVLANRRAHELMLMRSIRFGLLPNVFIKMYQPFVRHVFETHNQLPPLNI
jgi:hypothetical protein